MIPWEIQADELVACNCAYGCPCQFNALPTYGSGGETDPGSTMWNVYASTMEKVSDPVFKPIEIEVDVEARFGRIFVDGLVECSGEPIRNPVTSEPHRALIDLPDGFEYRLAEMGSATEPLLLDHYGVHVVGNDDRHDGTECGTDGPALYPGLPLCPENGPDGSSSHPRRCFYEWLSTDLAGIQPGCNRFAMVARTIGPDARHDDVDYEQRAVRIISDGRGRLSALATEKHLYETLPFTS